MNIDDVYFGRSEFLYMFVSIRSLCSPQLFRFEVLDTCKIQDILCDYVIKNMGKFTYSNCKLAS